MKHAFHLQSARAAANQGKISEWIQEYLRTGSTRPNLGLADGLNLAPRWWIGPFEAPLASLSRKSGPEPEMEYPVPLADWNTYVDMMAASIVSVEDLPPLIVERRSTGWFLADGNTRHEALRRKGITSCWVIGWLNSEAELKAVTKA